MAAFLWWLGELLPPAEKGQLLRLARAEERAAGSRSLLSLLQQPPGSTQVLSACGELTGAAVVRRSVWDWMPEYSSGKMGGKPQDPDSDVFSNPALPAITLTLSPICSCIYFSVGADPGED